MLRFAANLATLFNEVEFLERFAAAARAGFRGVEFLFPYGHDKEVLGERLESNDLVQVLHNLPAGNWEAGERGIACHPDRRGEFREGVGAAIDYATALSCRQVNCLAGIAPAGAPAEELRETLVANLRFAASELQKAGILLLIEPVNTKDIPGFFLSRLADARAIIEELGSDNLRLQYDIYHAQIMEGDLARSLESNLDLLGHVQLADNPGRHEPGTGEINFPFLFRHLERIGYRGWIGCEYEPLGTTHEGLEWAALYLQQRQAEHAGG
jgi:hydroxypyruvate isomerase